MLNAYVVRNNESLKVVVLTNSEERAIELASNKFREFSECLEFWDKQNLSCSILVENFDSDGIEEEYCSEPRMN